MDSNNEIDSIIEDLRADAVSTAIVEGSSTPEIVNDDNVSGYVYKKTAEVVQAGLDAINNLKNSIAMGADSKEVAALASLISATTKAIDSMNSINLQHKQASTSLELKKMDIAGKKEIVSKLPASNNILIATRDEVISQMVGGKSPKQRGEMLLND